ncbi:hypothetical protein HYC85_008880 [Camellia sinensis]|uniref:Uncharacterized protein n=1 Tax=Camellia sinensis TaxID=4442 RepID=A0A7J7HVB9_CAMSI|nr:hypothetical protein HYC85_008880 [Camellia sinensis]
MKKKKRLKTKNTNRAKIHIHFERESEQARERYKGGLPRNRDRPVLRLITRDGFPLGRSDLATIGMPKPHENQRTTLVVSVHQNLLTTNQSVWESR